MTDTFNKWCLSFFLCALAGTALAQTNQQGQESPPALVRVSVAQEVGMSPTTLLPGTVVSRDDAKIAAEVDGRLIEVVEIGTRVGKNDPLARIDDRELLLEQAESKAVMIREETGLSFANQEFERLKGLVEKGLVSSSQLDQARSTRDAARAELQAAQAKLDLINDRITRTTIRAPFDGVVTQRYRRVGEHVEEGVQVIRLVNPNTVEVQVRVSANNLPFTPIGKTILVQGNSGTTVTSSIRSVVPVGDDISRLYDVRLHLSDNAWPAGTTVRVAIPTAEARQVTAIPRDALVLRTDGITVFKVDHQNKAVKVAVATGIASEGMIEVIGDIQAGDRVVIRGNERLLPGSAVMIVNE